MAKKIVGRERRKLRIRKKISGTAERPRLTVFRSAKHIYAQVVDDASGRTLAEASTRSKELRDAVGGQKKVERAKKVGELVARHCREKGIARVVFDRNGYQFHGRVSALADAARKAGLVF